MSGLLPPIGALAAALSKAQADIHGALKDSKNPFFKSSYADLSSVWDACRIPLTKNKLCIIQTTEIGSDGTVLKTILAHESGEFICGEYPVKPVKDDPQSLGSAITYARRYALAAIVGVCPVDDDGEGAMNRVPAAVVVQRLPFEVPLNPEGYVLAIGKNKGKALKDVSPDALSGLVSYLEKTSHESGNNMGDVARETCEMVKLHLKKQGYEL